MQRGTTATQRVLVLGNGVVVSGQIASERIVGHPEVAERRETLVLYRMRPSLEA